MNVTVSFIGRYKSLTGGEITLTLSPGHTIYDVVTQLAQKYPEIEKDKKFLMVSKNNTYTTLKDSINDGDTITIIPPVVSGG